MRRTLLIRVAFCLILGVATSIGIAWAVALLGEGLPARADPQMRLVTQAEPIDGEFAWFVIRHHGPGHQVYRFKHGRTSFANIPGEDSWPLYGAPVSPDALPSWSGAPASGVFVEAHGYGWPRLALTGTHTWFGEPGTMVVIRHGVWHWDDVLLPVRPIWTGLSADSAVYGAAFWLAMFMPGRIRRRMRLRRGWCAACGYDLAGNTSGVCPECGWGREEIAKSQIAKGPNEEGQG